MPIHRLLLQAASTASSSTASAYNSSSTGTATTEDSSVNLAPLVYLAATLGGIMLLVIASRFTCRRVDACKTTAEQRQAREIAAGAPAGGITRELPATNNTNGQASDPLISNRPRSCFDRFFCAQTTGKGVCHDLGTSAAEGVYAAASLCMK